MQLPGVKDEFHHEGDMPCHMTNNFFITSGYFSSVNGFCRELAKQPQLEQSRPVSTFFFPMLHHN
jgi:hypothetical protein